MFKLIKQFTMSLYFFFTLTSVWAQTSIEITAVDEVQIPKQHLDYIQSIILTKADDCFQHGIDLETSVDPDAIYSLTVADNGALATIFHVALTCESLGDIWTSVSGIQTYILVDDLVFEGWLMAPPQRVILENKISLVFSLDESQCFTGRHFQTYEGLNCFAVLQWLPDFQIFYGHSMPIEFVEYIKAN